ncbi:hypothetical protein G6680_02070 [Polynucleobacter paneuropaeus]|nr:hypothetical protein [Polynucleobacter paneuropaeus]
MKPLQSWTPDTLKTLYEHEVYKLAHNEYADEKRELQNKKTEALYRLGTHHRMKDVWERLLAKDGVAIKYPVDKELALVSGIHGLIWLNPFGAKQATPGDKTKELKKIVKKIEDLVEDIENSGHASYWDEMAMETLLHKRNVDYRKEKGEVIGYQSLNFLKYIDINANAELSQIPLDEHMPWRDRLQAQRLGWWTREVMQLNLTDILNFYSELMMDSSEVYKENYEKDKPKLIRGLQRLMQSIYGSPLDTYVAELVSVIFEDDFLDRDNVKSYR